MRKIFPLKTIRICKNRGRFFKWDTVFFEVRDRFLDVP